jgi:hypothetical protein
MSPLPKVLIPTVERFVFAGRFGWILPHMSTANATFQSSEAVGPSFTGWSFSLRLYTTRPMPTMTMTTIDAYQSTGRRAL